MFSQQQIHGINYFYSKLREDSFDEDDVRLLLIHLREFLNARYGKKNQPPYEIALLLEAGDSVAHTVRHRGLVHARIKEILQAAQSEGFDLGSVPHPLFDIGAIVKALQSVVASTGIIYNPATVPETFQLRRLDLQICLMSMLNGMLFKIRYPTIRDDFYFLDTQDRHPAVHVRFELDLRNATSLREIRITALIPLYKGGNFGACVLICPVAESAKISSTALIRTGSNQGYCEPIKALRDNGQLRIIAVPQSVSSIAIYDVLRTKAYDTSPISTGIELTEIRILPSGELQQRKVKKRPKEKS